MPNLITFPEPRTPEEEKAASRFSIVRKLANLALSIDCAKISCKACDKPEKVRCQKIWEMQCKYLKWTDNQEHASGATIRAEYLEQARLKSGAAESRNITDKRQSSRVNISEKSGGDQKRLF